MCRRIKNWPKSERPRELLLEKGPEYVSDAGLVAILLRIGTKGKDAVTLGRELLNHFGGPKRPIDMFVNIVYLQYFIR